MTDKPRKRSLTIAGHRTSVSLEDDFWDALKAICKAEDRSLAQVISEIDSSRGTRSLSSAIRIMVLDHFRKSASRE